MEWQKHCLAIIKIVCRAIRVFVLFRLRAIPGHLINSTGNWTTNYQNVVCAFVGVELGLGVGWFVASGSTHSAVLEQSLVIWSVQQSWCLNCKNCTGMTVIIMNYKDSTGRNTVWAVVLRIVPRGKSRWCQQELILCANNVDTTGMAPEKLESVHTHKKRCVRIWMLRSTWLVDSLRWRYMTVQIALYRINGMESSPSPYQYNRNNKKTYKTLW